MTRNDILKALAYLNCDVEYFNTTPFKSLSMAERRILRLADALADEGLAIQAACEIVGCHRCGGTGTYTVVGYGDPDENGNPTPVPEPRQCECGGVVAQLVDAFETFKSAVIDKLKGGT